MSLHRYISFELDRSCISVRKQQSPRGWKVTYNGLEKVTAHVEEYGLAMRTPEPEGLDKSLRKICNRFLLFKRIGGNRKSVYWWNNAIAELRRNCIRLRRLIKRQNKRLGTHVAVTNLGEEYKGAKKKLKEEIARSKKQKWEELCDELNADVWGRAYRIVTRKFMNRARVPIPADEVREQVRALFPSRPDIEWGNLNIPTEEVPVFTTDEILSAARNIKNGKAVGLDGIPGEVLKAAALKDPESITNVMNWCLVRGHFPRLWKVGKLVLIEKPKMESSSAINYRPICLLNASGKLFESLIKARLETELEENDRLFDRQFGFRKGKFTINALSTIVEKVDLIRQLKE